MIHLEDMMKFMQVITVFLSKGGVGKTTLNTHMAFSLSRFGKVLLCDFDRQGNASLTYTDRASIKYDVVDYLTEQTSLEDTVIKVREQNEEHNELYLLGLKNDKERLPNFIEGEFRNNPMSLKSLIIDANEMDFDFVVFDLPSGWGYFHQEALRYTTEIIPIVNLDVYSMSELPIFTKNLIKHKKNYEGKYNIRFIVANKANARQTMHNNYLEALRNSPYKEVIVIPQLSEVLYAIDNKAILNEVAKKSRVAIPIDHLCNLITGNADERVTETTKGETK